MTLTFKEVTEILKLIDSSSCHELIIEVEGLKLAIRKGGQREDARSQLRDSEEASAWPVLSFPGETPQNPATSARPSHSSEGLSISTTSAIEVRAGMVGTFYRRPSPDDEPFVTVGSRVRKGDPLGLIEVMKLHTSIACPTDGTVASINVEDGKPVEFDQLLFLLSPA